MKILGTTGAVLGNGPSRDMFNFQADCVIGCNIPGEGFSVDATVITDVEVVWVLKNNPELINCPLILSTTAYEKMKQLNIDDQFEINHIFKPRPWYTSGHYATLFLTNILGCEIIHIWGCDSYFKDDASSITDQLVPKSGDLFYKQWRNSWDTIFKSNPSVFYSIKRT